MWKNASQELIKAGSMAVALWGAEPLLLSGVFQHIHSWSASLHPHHLSPELAERLPGF